MKAHNKEQLWELYRKTYIIGILTILDLIIAFIEKNCLPSPCTVNNLTLAINLKLLVYNTPLFHSEKDTQKFPDKTKRENFFLKIK